MPETNYTHGKCRLNAGKSHYASTCPFTWNFKKCPQFEENLNYEADKKNERLKYVHDEECSN